jgi:predicted enzyme related to lactoylglutathione lyase
VSRSAVRHGRAPEACSGPERARPVQGNAYPAFARLGEPIGNVGASMEPVPGSTPEGAPGGVTFYVDSGDVAGTLRQVEELGGRKVAGPMDMPDGHKWALFADPEGHVVGLYGRG